eukprot:3239952-Pyramimonas_sp.AAC.1
MGGGMVSCAVAMARGSHSATSRFLRAWARMTYAKSVAYRRFDPHSAESAASPVLVVARRWVRPCRVFRVDHPFPS